MPVTAVREHLNVVTALAGVAVAIALLGIGLSTQSTTMTTTATIVGAGVALVVVWVDRRRAFPLLAFLTCYDLFLLGRQTVNLLLGVPTGQDGVLGTGASSVTSMQHTNVALLVGVVGLLAGWLLTPRGGRPTAAAISDMAPAVRRAAARLMVVSVPGVLYATWTTMTTISTAGYYDGRLIAAAAIPFPVRVLESLFHAAFFAFIAARPARREAGRACLAYLVVAALSLATLARVEFLLSAMAVAVYLFHRQVSFGEKWFSGRRVAAVALTTLPLLGLLNRLGSLRGRGPEATTGIFAPILDFLRSQGVSVKVVVFGDELSSWIPDGRWYTVGPLVEFGQRVWGGISGSSQPALQGQSAERALEGHQFAHTISYLISPFDYLRGTGFGSSYVAELMVDLGLVGVFVGSAVYGFLLVKASDNLLRSIPLAFITLMLLKGAMFVPRASFVQPLVDPFAAPSLASLVILLVGVQLARDRNPPADGHPPRTAPLELRR